MLKQFKYIFITLLCSSVIACSSGGSKGSSNSSQAQQESSEQPKKESSEQPKQESSEQPKQESSEQPKQESSEQPKQESSEQPKQESSEQPKQESSEQPKQESSEQPKQESAEQPKQESSEQPKQESADQPKQESSEQPAIEKQFLINAESLDNSTRHREESLTNVKALIIQNNELVLSSGELINSHNLKRTRHSLGDVGINLYQLDPNSIPASLGAQRRFENKKLGLKVDLRDMQQAGWQYQTFGTFLDIPEHAWISVGETTKNLPIANTFTYKGISVANATDKENDNSSVNNGLVSNITIVADFADKSLQFSSTDTKGIEFMNNLPSKVVDYADFNLTGQATWSGNQNMFEGTVATQSGLQGKLKGAFYGPEAEEVGGTFKLDDTKKSYLGGFGGKR